VTRLAQLGEGFILGEDPRFLLGNYWVEENPIDDLTDVIFEPPELLEVEIVEDAQLVAVNYVRPAELLTVEAA
jgi:hypothetical protein